MNYVPDLNIQYFQQSNSSDEAYGLADPRTWLSEQFSCVSCENMSSKNIDFLRKDSDQSSCDNTAGCLTRGLLCRLKLPSNWITGNFSTCALTASLQTYRAKIFETKTIKQNTYHPFSLTATVHCTAVNCRNGPISTDSDETVLVSNLVWEQLNKNEEKCLSCLSLYNVKHWSHVNKK